MIKVGFIGLGQMGLMHLVNCLHIQGVKVVAVADSSKKALNKAKAYGVNGLYFDYAELIDKEGNDLDAVIISVPNYLHYETIMLSLEYGLNIFAEKPLAVNVKQCREIERAVQTSGKKFMLGHNLRFVPAVEIIKERIDKGVIGNIEVVTLEEILNGPFSHPRVPVPVADWWFDPQKSGGGVLIDLGYHMIDLFRFFTGEDSKVLFADFSYKYNLPVEEGATVILSTGDSLIRGIINVGWFQRSVFPKYNFRAILHGDSGYLSTEDFVPKRIYSYAAKEGLKNILRRVIGKKLRPLSYTYYWGSYYKELAVFFDCLKRDLETPITVIDGLKTMQIIEEAYALFRDKFRDEINAKMCEPS